LPVFRIDRLARVIPIYISIFGKTFRTTTGWLRSFS
jgi:hypothetical protein